MLQTNLTRSLKNKQNSGSLSKERSKLLLHIGFPKSASTYLQQTLQFNSYKHKNRDKYYYSNNLDHINEIIRREKTDIFIHSDENYLCIPIENYRSEEKSRSSTDTKIDDFRENFAATSARIQHDALEVKILVVYREPKKFLGSWYKEMVRYGRYEHEFARFLNDWELFFKYNLNLKHIDDLIRKTFENPTIIYLPYELMITDLDLWREEVSIFFEGFIKAFKSDIIRPSLSNGVSELFRLQNAFLNRGVPRAAAAYRSFGNEKVAKELEEFQQKFPRILNLLTQSSAENIRLLDSLCASLELSTFSHGDLIDQRLDELASSIDRSNKIFLEKHSRQHSDKIGTSIK